MCAQRVRRVCCPCTGFVQRTGTPPALPPPPQVQELSQDGQRFTMRLPVALSEAATINYAVYRASSCITGAQNPAWLTRREARRAAALGMLDTSHIEIHVCFCRIHTLLLGS